MNKNLINFCFKLKVYFYLSLFLININLLNYILNMHMKVKDDTIIRYLRNKR